MKPSQRIPPRHDCSYEGYDRAVNRFIVREQLYPEGRGFLSYSFDSEKEAVAWLEALPCAPSSTPAEDATEDAALECAALERTARAVQREYLKLFPSHDFAGRAAEDDFDKNREMYLRLAAAARDSS